MLRYDLNLLPIFVALLEELSVTRAAERLGMTQPALSHALARLRTTMKDQLFIRARYGQQPMTIAPNGYVEFVLVPAIVARLGEVAPGIRLRLTPYGNDLTETGVTSGMTAMVLGRIVDPPDNLVVQHLMDDGFACVVRADHPDISASISRKQFERMKHVNVQPPGRLRAGLFESVTAADVARAAQKYLDVSKMTTIVVGKPEKLTSTAKRPRSAPIRYVLR